MPFPGKHLAKVQTMTNVISGCEKNTSALVLGQGLHNYCTFFSRVPGNAGTALVETWGP